MSMPGGCAGWRSPESGARPTFREAGFGDVTASTYWGALVPAGVPAPVIARLSEAFRAGVTHPDVQDRLRGLGFEPIGGSPSDYAANIASETEKWARVVRQANVKLD
jgi:tripartite-type tricarboxylate transporter receptor subunit TctC